VLPTRAVLVTILLMSFRLAVAPALTLTLSLPLAVLCPGRSCLYLGVAPLGALLLRTVLEGRAGLLVGNPVGFRLLLSRGCNRYRCHRLLDVLPDDSVPRLVAIVAAMQCLLLLDVGIPISRVLPLIDRQRGRCQ